MIGTKINKPIVTQEQADIYAQAAEWCNTTQQGTIEDKGEYYEVVEIPPPSLEEAKAAINDAPGFIGKGLIDEDRNGIPDEWQNKEEKNDKTDFH